LKNAEKISRIVHLNKAIEPKLKFIFAAKLSQLYSILQSFSAVYLLLSLRQLFMLVNLWYSR